MTEKIRRSDPKAMKTTLPVVLTNHTHTIVDHELILLSLLTANLTDTHESLYSAAKTKCFNKYSDTI